MFHFTANWMMRCATLVAVLGVVGSVDAQDLVNLEWRPAEVTVEVGETFELGLYAVSATGEVEEFSAAQVIVLWDTDCLEFEGIINNSDYQWMSIGFPPDAGGDGLNLDLDDGDAWLQAWASFGGYPQATPEGMLITTFEFRLVSETQSTAVEIEAEFGEKTRTAVISSVVPGLDILGQVSDAYAGVLCDGSHDSDQDCDVDLVDFAAFQNCFSGSGISASTECLATFDIDLDEDVDIDDYADFGDLVAGPAA
jgi:hypothetical protein